MRTCEKGWRARLKDRRLTYLGTAIAGGVLARKLLRLRTSYDLRDKVAVITGGSRGLGLLMARELVARGAKVTICARDKDELERARADLEARGGDVLAVVCDITDRDQVELVVASARARFGTIDIVINNAGIIEVGPLELMTLRDYERAMATHFWGPLYMLKAVIPEMIARGHGRIVNITSIGGKVAVPHLLPYTASKFALVGMSEGASVELARYGVRVTTVVPGLMRTGSAINAQFKGRHRDEYAWFASGASLPLTSMNAARAARKIIDAMQHGRSTVVLSTQAKLLAVLNVVAPRLVHRVLALVDRLLPQPGGIGPELATGRDSTGRVPAFVERANERAARRSNEL